MAEDNKRWRGRLAKLPRYNILVPHPENKYEDWIETHKGLVLQDNGRPARVFVGFYTPAEGPDDTSAAQLAALCIANGALATAIHKDVTVALVGFHEQPAALAKPEPDLIEVQKQFAKWSNIAADCFHSYIHANQNLDRNERAR